MLEFPMSIKIKELPDDTKSLKNIIVDLEKQHQQNLKEQKEIVREQQFKYQILEEKFLSLQHRFFARSSEKLSEEGQKQLRLFNEAEVGVEETEKTEEETEKVTIKEYTRKKPGRKPLPENLPREEIIHDLPEEEKKCSSCGKERPKIGEEISEELDIIPAEIKINKHIRLKYGPCKCEGFSENEEPEVKTAKAPDRIIPGSIVSPGLLAYVLVAKFCDALPFYRQENIFKRINVEISRATMCNWTIQASRKCQELLEIMWREIRSGPLIQMDETTLQVLNEPDRLATSKSYMWVTIGYKDKKSIIIYHYHPTRSKEVPLKVLDGYKGYLQTDGYAGYNDAGSQPGVNHVGCFAHSRRYFMDALNVSKNSGSLREGLSYIQKLYEIEKRLGSKELSDGIFVKQRKQEVMPVFEKFKKWLDKKMLQVPPETKIGKAVNYTLGEWNKLTRYIEASFLTPDNNRSENAIRPFVIGRKNWLFSNTPRGAYASACIYSLIESAKANGLEPYRYLRYLFTKLPITKSEKLKELLPTEIDATSLYSV